MADNTTQLWPGWVTEERIGEGSFGAVYKISRQFMDTPEYAALKVLSIPRSDSEIQKLRTDGYTNSSISAEFSERLNRIHGEYAMLARMKDCANVVSCEDIRTVQQDNGFGWDIYIKMELLVPLKKAISTSISEKQVIKLGMDMCNALIYCEQLGVVHRDIKPENIFVTGDGSLYKLGDFGIARTMERTTIGTKAGTFEYMAPEVYSFRPYNTTADIYSLGLVLYWMLNDRALPFWPRGVERVTLDQREQARDRRFGGEPLPPPAHGFRELQRIVLKACAFYPADRYATAEDMRRDLERAELLLRAGELTDTAGAGAAGAGTTITGTSDSSGSYTIPVSHPEDPAKKAPLLGRNTLLILLALAVAVAFCGGLYLTRKLADPEPSVVGPSAPASVSGPAVQDCSHQWQPADCTTPQTCTLCSQTRGTPLGHIWQLATCSAPKTCNVCSETVGTPLEHDWQAATCTQPKTCAVCGEASGEPLGHQWAEATLTAPKTCTLCGTTEGIPLTPKYYAGDTVYFGSYEQDNIVSNGSEPIEWMVLDIRDDALLLLSRYCLDVQHDNVGGSVGTTWDNCSLRTWLNSTFLKNAFSHQQQEDILQTNVHTPRNPVHNTYGGADTVDRIFLLSSDEVSTYIPDKFEMMAQSTAYALARGAYRQQQYGTSWWWLRTPGKSDNPLAYVSSWATGIDFASENIFPQNGAVRPAMWVKITSADLSTEKPN